MFFLHVPENGTITPSVGIFNRCTRIKGHSNCAVFAMDGLATDSAVFPTFWKVYKHCVLLIIRVIISLYNTWGEWRNQTRMLVSKLWPCALLVASLHVTAAQFLCLCYGRHNPNNWCEHIMYSACTYSFRVNQRVNIFWQASYGEDDGEAHPSTTSPIMHPKFHHSPRVL